MPRSIINLTINVDNLGACDELGNPVAAPLIYRGSRYVLRLTLIHGDTSEVILDPAAQYYAGVGYTGDHSEDDLCTTPNAGFNLVADWPEVDPEAGLICFRLDADTDELATYVGSSPYAGATLETWVVDSGTPVMLARIPLRIMNVAVEPDEDTEDYSSSSSSRNSSSSSKNSSSSKSSSSSETT